ERAGVAVFLRAKATGLVNGGNRSAVQVQTKDGTKHEVLGDAVFGTVGRRPRTKGWGLERMAVDMRGPFVRVDDCCRTSVRNVWAIGDLVGEPMLAHKASALGEMVADIIAGARRRFAPATVAAVCFTEPEIVSAGLSPAEAADSGIDCMTGLFPFAANGRALSMEAGEEGGFVRVVARRDNHRVIGVQAVGAHVSKLVGAIRHRNRNGRGAGGHRRQDPCPPDAQRGIPRIGAARARSRHPHLSGRPSPGRRAALLDRERAARA
ncbi:MAG: FAD-dependent oxidoreductase, partial [Acetobacteraceae bacterium]|nr:FAD-dependent oxidoreductase [Acetobacteraceae bacterium]